MEKTYPDGARELPPSGVEQVPHHHIQTVSSATNTGEKRKREGLGSGERETGNSIENEQVIVVGDTKAIKDLCFAGVKQSERSMFSKRQAFDVQSIRNGNGSLVKEEPERANQIFNDFDKLRDENNFAVGQIWALYDTLDGMPRLYAQIRTVSARGFNVTVTWLEPDPYDEEPIQSYQKDLPVSVGRFKLGTIKDHRRFSHLVHCNEGNGAGKFSVYPREGETWVMFKGRTKCYFKRDIKWLADPDSPWKYQYAFVQIVSGYADERNPLSVGFLHKAKGFLSLFCRFTEKIDKSYVAHYDDRQFSHRVPSFKVTGKEAEGVPQGAYELDPAALPGNIKEIDVPLHLLAEPTVSISENNTDSPCVHFASDGRTFQTGQIWSFCSTGDDYLPRHYGKIQKITFVQAFEQDPVVKLHVGRLKATQNKGVIQWDDKRMPIGCGNFRARKALEIFTDLDVFSRQICLDSSGDANDYSIMPKTGDVWAIYRNWSHVLEIADLQSQTYDLVEVLDDKLDYKVLLLAPVGGFKVADYGSVYLAATEHWIDGDDVRFTIPKSELLTFSHQVLTSKVTKEINGALQEVYEPNIEGLPVNVVFLFLKSNSSKICQYSLFLK